MALLKTPAKGEAVIRGSGQTAQAINLHLRDGDWCEKLASTRGNWIKDSGQRGGRSRMVIPPLGEVLCGLDLQVLTVGKLENWNLKYK